MKKIDSAEQRARVMRNLPQKGSPENISKNQKLVLTDEQRLKKGKDAEDRFLKAWEVRQTGPKPPFMRRATLQEDLYEKTDAIVETTKYGEFRIQIKSYPTTDNKFRWFCKRNIVLLSVLPEHTYKDIRENTEKAIRAYLAFKSASS